MIDAVLVSMPFGPLFSPSLALSLLQPQLESRGLSCRVEYFTLPFAEIIGHALYSKITDEHPALTRAFAGEWIFSNAVFDWPPEAEERYIRDVLMAPPSWLARNRVRRPSAADVRALRQARAAARDFVERCADRLAALEPRIVGLTSVFQQHLASLALAQRLKARLPQVAIVMGGANCEGVMGAETLRQFPAVDAVVSGEGDRAFPELAARLLSGDPIAGVDGVLTRGMLDAAFATTRFPSSAAVHEMDALPYPEYRDFFEQFAHTRFARAWQPHVYVETSRGCWWGERMHCTFCGLNGATMAFRSKSPGRALDELTHLAAAHPGCDIQVVDNILDLQYFKTLLPALAERKLKVALFYETKSNLKKDQVRLLRDAGITMIQPGIESFSDSVLALMKKGVSGLQNIQLLKWCKEIGIEPMWNFLLGFPGESPEEYARLADLTGRLCHLPSPVGVSAIRLDRFSPNFTDSDRLGFTRVRPLPFYEFLYDLPEEARRNLAYFFAYDYRRPQDVARYAAPLMKRVHAWRTTWRHAELLSVDVDGTLVLFDTRPSAAAPVSILSGDERALYLACDAVSDAPRLGAALGGAPADGIARRLAPLVDRGLMLAEKGRYLSLAVPLGEYRPSAPVADSLWSLFGAIGVSDRGGIRIPLDRPEYVAGGPRVARPAVRRAPRRRRGALTPSNFTLVADHQLYVRHRQP